MRVVTVPGEECKEKGYRGWPPTVKAQRGYRGTGSKVWGWDGGK